MISVLVTIYGTRRVVLDEHNVEGKSLDSIFVKVSRAIRQGRKKEGPLDPIRNWKTIDVSIAKMPKLKKEIKE